MFLCLCRITATVASEMHSGASVSEKFDKTALARFDNNYVFLVNVCFIYQRNLSVEFVRVTMQYKP